VSLNRSEQTVSVQEYLEGEKESPIRHEYVNGYVYAMAGASDRHNRIALNIASRLNQLLIEGPCEVFISDMKLRVSPNVYYYPDVVVCCDSPPLDAYVRSQPVLIIEVTSPTTQRIDHHEKLLASQHISGVARIRPNIPGSRPSRGTPASQRSVATRNSQPGDGPINAGIRQPQHQAC